MENFVKYNNEIIEVCPTNNFNNNYFWWNHPEGDSGVSVYKGVIVVWDCDYDTRILQHIDTIPTNVLKKIKKIGEHKAGLIVVPINNESFHYLCGYYKANEEGCVDVRITSNEKEIYTESEIVVKLFNVEDHWNLEIINPSKRY